MPRPPADRPVVSGTRRGFLVLSGGVVATTAVPAPSLAGSRPNDPRVPTWRQVHGYDLGSRAATVSELDAYAGKLARVSDRVLVEPLGRSVEGRAMRAVVVSSPRNLRRLEELRATAAALRDRPTTLTDAARSARDLPAFVVLLPNVHGNEPSGSDALMRVLHDLAAGTDEETRRRLDELVVVMATTQNPDGRENGTRPNARGFDLNRDWFAMTQPETPAKIDLYRRYPAVVGLDLHEQFFQGPDAYFFPPNADPIHREVSRTGLQAANRVLSPAVAAAFDREGWSYDHYGIYDLFAPIYGDSVPNQAFGAAGFLMEMANEAIYPTKVDRVYTATDAALGAVVEHRRRLVRAWARQWVQAEREGRRGLRPTNLVQDPANTGAPVPAARARVYGYAIRADRRSADVAHLVDRLLRFGIRVDVTERRLHAPRMRRFGGERFEPSTLPRGTVIVTTAQPMQRFVHTLLEDDPAAAVPYFYDVSGWSNPLLMRLDGGALGSPVDTWYDGGRDVRRVRRVGDLRPAPTRARSAAGYSFRLDSVTAQVAAFDLVARGVEVRRSMRAAPGVPAGAAVVPARSYHALAAVAGRLGVPVRAIRGLPDGAQAVRRPRVLVVHDLVSELLESMFARSSGYAQWLLQDRFGLPVRTALATAVDLGALAAEDVDVVVVPDGFATVLPADYPNLNLSVPGAGMTPLGLLQLRDFVRRGGTYLGWGQQGVTTAQVAGLAGDLEMTIPLGGLQVPGSPFRSVVRGGDPATVGLTGRSTVFNFRDPVLRRGGTPLVTYPSDVRSFGWSEGAGTLAGTVAATGQQVGSGRSYVCAFDPAVRGWCEATQALVGGMLLAPAPTGAGPDPAPLLDGLLPLRTPVVTPGRQSVVRVADRDAGALRAAVAAAPDLPPVHTWYDARGGLELRFPDVRGLGGHAPGWLRSLQADLAARGVRPTLIIG